MVWKTAEAGVATNKWCRIGKFFNKRALKNQSVEVSPVDGEVMQLGEVENFRISEVKGYDYDVREFLGPVEFNTHVSFYFNELIKNKHTEIMQKW